MFCKRRSVPQLLGNSPPGSGHNPRIETNELCAAKELDSAHLQRLDQPRRNAVLVVTKAKLTVLVAAKGVQPPRVGDRERVRIAAGDARHPQPRKRADGARYEHVVAVAVPQPAKVAPAAVTFFSIV